MAGKPRKYDSVEDLQRAIDEYFDSCVPEYPKDEDGNLLTTKKGTPLIIEHPPSVTGLALALGFTSRQALLNYQDYGKEYLDTIKKARLKIEQDVVEGASTGRLHPVFSIFNLKNNFDWKDLKEPTQPVDRPTFPFESESDELLRSETDTKRFIE